MGPSLEPKLVLIITKFNPGWYSTETYYLVKFIIDLVPNITAIIISTIYIQLRYKSFDIFILFLVPNILSAISCQSVGHLLAITCGPNALMGHVLLLSLILLYCGAVTREEDLFELTKYVTMLSPAKETIIRIVTYLYGFDRCPSGQTSAIVSYMGWTDDLYDRSLYLMIFQSVFFTLLAYICLKLKTF